MLLFWFPATLELLSFLDSLSLHCFKSTSPPLPLPSLFLSNSLSPFPSTIFIPRSFPWFLPGIILIHIHPFQSLFPSLSLSLFLSLLSILFIALRYHFNIPSSPKTSSFRPKLFFPSFYYFLHHIKPANFPPSPLITIHYESSSMTNLFLLSPSFSSNFTTPLAATLRSNRKKVRKKKKNSVSSLSLGGFQHPRNHQLQREREGERDEEERFLGERLFHPLRSHSYLSRYKRAQPPVSRVLHHQRVVECVEH